MIASRAIGPPPSVFGIEIFGIESCGMEKLPPCRSAQCPSCGSTFAIAAAASVAATLGESDVGSLSLISADVGVLREAAAA